MTEDAYMPATSAASSTHPDKGDSSSGAQCNHSKKEDTSPGPQEEPQVQTQERDSCYQDNLAFRDRDLELDEARDHVSHVSPERECYLPAPDTESGSWSCDGSYPSSEVGQQQPGYRIPYTMMREREGVAAVSPPPQPTHRAPGLPPAYRSYSHPRTMLVEAAQPSYVSSVCSVQPRARRRLDQDQEESEAE